MNIKSALRDDITVSYGIISILRIGSLRSPPPIRLRLWTHLRCEGSEGSKGSKGKVDGPPGRRLWPPVGGGLCSLRSGGDSPDGLRVVVAASPRILKSALRNLLSVSYGKISITMISHLRWLFPLWCLTAPPSRPAGKRVTRFSGRFAPLQHGYHRLTIFCASLRSFKICSLV